MRFPLLSVLTIVPAIQPHRTFTSAFSLRPNDSYKRSIQTQLRTSALESLADITTLSIDSGDIDTVSKYAKTGLITDATTNPLFVSQAGSNGDSRYESMVAEALSYAKSKTCAQDGCDLVEDTLNLAIDRLAVNLGKVLVGLVPGRVSTEVDIRLSYDTEGSVKRGRFIRSASSASGITFPSSKNILLICSAMESSFLARSIIAMYEELGISKDRILIKLAGTWEGIQAARILEKQGIRCNITLVFSFLQAAAAAQAGAYLISPFPGRILDWHKKKSGKDAYAPDADPGVLSVRRMYAYFRKYNYDTICMPASWRPSRGVGVEGSEVDEILALAGIDEMTLPPLLLDSLSALPSGMIVRKCEAKAEAAACIDPDFILTEESYKAYWETDVCGKEKLREGIDAFTAETDKLIKILIEKI